MAADFDAQVLDDYLIAQYAYWAGDFDYAQERYAKAIGRTVLADFDEIAQKQDDSMIESLDVPDDLLSYVANRRGRRIGKSRRAFEEMASSFSPELSNVVSQPLILESGRLRGAIWRIDRRDFRMKAYVISVKYWNRVLSKAQSLAKKGAIELGVPFKARPARNDQAYASALYEWEEDDNPEVAVTVTGLGFIEAVAHWTGRMPTSFVPIQERFQAVLDSLSK